MTVASLELQRAIAVAIALSLTLAIAAPALAATPLDTRHARETVTLDYLMESCTVVGETAHGRVAHFDCESFLYGVIDTVATQTAEAGAGHHCMPAALAPWRLYERIDGRIPRERWNEPAARLLVELLRREFPCTVPLAPGEYAFEQRFAEHPLMPGTGVVAVIAGDRIRIEDRRRSEERPDGSVLAEGTLAWHAPSRQWIIVTPATDPEASEVGGCTDGAEVVDFVAKTYWTC